MMKTYWDLSEQERAALDRDGVAAYVDAELMLKGVLRPDPLVLVSVVEPAIETESFYRVGDAKYDKIGFAFRSKENAEAFLSLGAVRVSSDWRAGSIEVAGEQLTANESVWTDRLPTSATVDRHLSALKEANAAKNENDRRRSAHLKASEAAEKVLKNLWEDWHECTEKAAQMAKVSSTFERYTRLAGGDVEVASKFLQQAFTEAELRAAEEWTGVKMVVGPTPEIVAYAASAP